MPSTSTDSSATATVSRPHMPKLHRRFAPIAFAFYMATIMAFLMCCVIVASHSGFSAGYIGRVLKAYMLAMPAAFCCVMLVRPVVGRLVAATVHP